MSNSSQDATDYLERFGLAAFRSGQRDVIDAVLAGENCVCIMPTGGGKSLCYQLPSIMRPGVTLVVSPLIALMKDQVDALTHLGLRAACINSALHPSEQAQRMAQMRAGELDLIYIAPERFRSPRFVEALRGTKIQLLAVDEAHCISEWGHDFRPDYARLGWFRQKVGNPPTIALTATATPAVRDDIIKQLRLDSPRAFMAGFSRPNLRFEVNSTRSARDKDKVLTDFLNQTPGSGIIYTSARKRCDEVAEVVRAAGRSVGVYHAGLMPDERKNAQEQFMTGRNEVVVATVAFGMGIDKADVRFVAHYNMPGSIEAYYQEAGRAGRDGQPSRCLLVYTASDRYVQEYFIDNRYPSREVVKRVYQYLCELSDDPIERTQLDIKEELQLEVGGEGVGACLQLLQKAGGIERLEPLQNRALMRINSDTASVVDLLPATAKSQRKVMNALQSIVGERRFEDIYFHPRALCETLGMENAAISRALREMRKLEAFDYVPPFRGRALRVTQPRRRFEQLAIDFGAYQERKDAEYAKLEEMIAYATTRDCRQLQILRYFGDEHEQRCGNCDRCCPHVAPPAAPPSLASPKLVHTVRIALSGVARADGRVGKQVIAQMLGGSQANKIAKLKLNKLSTFGMLKHLKQTEIATLLDTMLGAELIKQHESQRYRPVVRLTELGRHVMNKRQGLPPNLSVPGDTLESIERHEFPPEPSAPRPGASTKHPPEKPPEQPRDEQASETDETQQRIDSSHETSRPAYYWTWRLLSAGFRVEECCQIRRLSREDILSHALEAMDSSLALDLRWIFTPDEMAVIEDESSPSPPMAATDSAATDNAARRLYERYRLQHPRPKANY